VRTGHDLDGNVVELDELGTAVKNPLAAEAVAMAALAGDDRPAGLGLPKRSDSKRAPAPAAGAASAATTPSKASPAAGASASTGSGAPAAPLAWSWSPATDRALLSLCSELAFDYSAVAAGLGKRFAQMRAPSAEQCRVRYATVEAAFVSACLV
jgi:hypothetical protein